MLPEKDLTVSLTSGANLSVVSLNYNHMGAYQTVPSDFGNLCSFSDGTIRFWKFAFIFGRYRPTSKTTSVFGQYCPTSETCVNFRTVLSDFENLRPFSNSTARLQTPASILRQYRKTSNFLNRTAVVSLCSTKRSAAVPHG